MVQIRHRTIPFTGPRDRPATASGTRASLVQRALGVGSIALGASIAAAVVLGPLVSGAIRFRTSAHIENQFLGGEVVSLALVAPMAIAGGVLALRRHRLAPAITLGPALYSVYTYLTVVVGQEYARYPGNVETFFPLYAGLVAAGGAVAALAWSQLAAPPDGIRSDRLRRGLSGTFLTIGGFFALAWSAQIRDVLSGSPPAEYLEGPTLFWTIKLLDFGFMIPALVVTGAGLLRRSPLAMKAATGLAPVATCLAASIAGMAIAMEVTDDPSSEPVMLAFVVPVAALLAGLSAALLREQARTQLQADAIS